MPDNTTINAATGEEDIATDDITDGGVADGAKVQRVKAGFGVDNAYADVSAADPLPVTVSTLRAQASATPSTSDALPFLGPIDASPYFSGVLRVKASEDFELVDPGSVPSIWVGTRSDADPVDSYWDVPLEFPPTDSLENQPNFDNVVQVSGSFGVAGVATFPVRARYVAAFINNPDYVSAGTIEVELLLRGEPYVSALNHVTMYGPVTVSQIDGVLPTVPALASGGGNLAELDATGNVPEPAARGVRVDIAGTWVGEITFPAWMLNVDTGEWVTSTTANGNFVGVRRGPTTDNAGFIVAMTAYTSGAAEVSMAAWAAGAAVELTTPFSNGAPVATANPLPVAVVSGGGGGGGGSVTVDNFPSTYPVTDNGGSLTVDGAVSVSNFPAAQPVTDNGGSLTVDGSVSVSNFPAAQPVTDNGGSLTVDGAVSVSNFPAAQPVTDNGGSLTVDDGGASLTVDGTVTAAGSGTTASGSASSATDIIASTDVSAYRSWSVQVTGTWSGICVVQACNDGTNWLTVPPNGLGFNGGTNPTGAGITANGLYTGSVVAKYLRLRCTTYTSGTVSAVLFLTTAGEPAQALYAWDGSLVRPLRMDSANDINALRTRESAPTASTLGAVAGSATSVTLLASNAARRGAIVWNESTATLYVALSATAATSTYTWQVAPGGYVELPQPCYTGVIAGIWSAANGFARVTELST